MKNITSCFYLEEELLCQAQLLMEIVQSGCYESVNELKQIAENIKEIISEMEKMKNGDC